MAHNIEQSAAERVVDPAEQRKMVLANALGLLAYVEHRPPTAPLPLIGGEVVKD